MNADSFYILLLCYLSGFTTCVFLASGIFLLRRHSKYLFQKIFAWVLMLHGVGFANNFVVAAADGLPCSDFLNTLLLLYDYVIVGGYMMFAVALVFPNRFSLWKLAWIEVPFVVAMALFAVTQSTAVYPAVQLFTPVASLALLIWLEHSIRRHTRMLKDNVGNLESYDLRWSSLFLAILFVVQCVWTFESMSQKRWYAGSDVRGNLLFDALWCVVCMVLVLLAMRRIVRQEVFTLAPEAGDDPVSEKNSDTESATGGSVSSTNSSYHQSLNDKNIEALIWDQRLYADKTLTLQKLSSLLGTNRQYLSNYINQERHMTFYEYINDFRLRAAKELLDTRQASIEEVADQAGFNSYATFLRSFRKWYGQTPSDYLKSINPQNI